MPRPGPSRRWARGGSDGLGCDRPDIRSIDINPLIVSGAMPVVVDALVELEGDAA